MTPFADDTAATSIGDMQVENGRDRIAVYGSLDVTRDKAGLALAHALRAFLADHLARFEIPRFIHVATAPLARTEEGRQSAKSIQLIQALSCFCEVMLDHLLDCHKQQAP